MVKKPEEAMAEPKQEEVKAEAGSCPWCDKQRADKVKDYPKESKIDNWNGNLQCGTCGKDWKKSDLGKPWSIELERGEAWAREQAARQLHR